MTRACTFHERLEGRRLLSGDLAGQVYVTQMSYEGATFPPPETWVPAVAYRVPSCVLQLLPSGT